jgi:hypothetical protein
MLIGRIVLLLEGGYSPPAVADSGIWSFSYPPSISFRRPPSYNVNEEVNDPDASMTYRYLVYPCVIRREYVGFTRPYTCATKVINDSHIRLSKRLSAVVIVIVPS